jgi:hypothetical protein
MAAMLFTSPSNNCRAPIYSAGIAHRGNSMRKLIFALAATSLVMPVMDSPASARPHYYRGKVWHDSQGRLRCHRPNGTTGLIVGAAGGALLGRAIDTHGERATGTILGAVGGALAGRAIDRSRVTCR